MLRKQPNLESTEVRHLSELPSRPIARHRRQTERTWTTRPRLQHRHDRRTTHTIGVKKNDSSRQASEKIAVEHAEEQQPMGKGE